MKTIIFRLTKGTDLRKGIEDYLYCRHQLNGTVVSGVGCVSKVAIRLAGAQESIDKLADYEIVSLNGTCSKDGSHLHISLSDNSGQTLGGHLKYGTIVNTTCEVVFIYLDELVLGRKMDNDTGYNELIIEEK